MNVGICRLSGASSISRWQRYPASSRHSAAISIVRRPCPPAHRACPAYAIGIECDRCSSVVFSARCRHLIASSCSPALVGVTGVEARQLCPDLENLIIEMQLPKQIGELLFQDLLPHILLAAGGGVALAFIGIAGAVIIDVALFLDFPDAPGQPASFEQAINPEKAKSCVIRRLPFLASASRPGVTACTRSHNSIETSGSCRPWIILPFHSNQPV